MANQLLIIAFSLSAAALSATTVFASGGGGGYGGSYNSSPRPAKPVDQVYEYGKAIYSGRITKIGKVKFCVSQGEEIVKVKRKTLKPYAGKKINDLAISLFNCDMPEEKILDKLGTENTKYVLYYLNKRFKLNLS